MDTLVLESRNGCEQPLTPIQEDILRLKKEKNAVILAHNYQIDDIQRVADFVGDSLGLAYEASQTKAEIIVFCGVHFMAETAKIVNPSRKVLLPDMDAGCSLADSCPADKLARYKEKHPDTFVVAYINCSAAVKALADVICTSGNAEKIVARVPAEKPILFVPDQNLGQWVTSQTGRPMTLWPGSCYAHVLFTRTILEELKLQYPDAPLVAHPECTEPVREIADEVCSTEKMLGFCKNTPAENIIVVTETGMINRLRREIPGKKFIAGPTETCACNDCRYMKLNTIEKLRDTLLHEQPEISMDETIREAAWKPLNRMLEWSK